ncbi:MAG: AAA family ATPase [Gemmatimonadota bacterium]|nr:AAA family ATPase [Gemmatimonadota bacterium]
MKIELENLGVLKKAEFELGELTLICGGNNTGKTYATYALFGFLSHWRRHIKAGVPDSTIQELLQELLSDGVTRLDVVSFAKEARHILRKGCEEFTRQLPRIFASKSGRFNNTRFQVFVETEKLSSIKNHAFEHTMRSADDDLISLSKAGGENEVVVSLLMEKQKGGLPESLIEEVISDGIVELTFGQFFPSPFIASTERTGAAIFRKELNFARNRLLEDMNRVDRDINPMELMSKSYQDYPLPVKDNVDFIGQLEEVAKRNSYLVENHPHILDDFVDIIGGEYVAGNNDTIYFKPVRGQLKLTMDESSSAVRSLLDIGFYLRHVAKPGDLLMVDEPELNLHPENQRRIARLFARLVNLGIRVFVTTHSDYIVKELNTLIMLNHDKPYLKKIAEREGYSCEEFLSAGKIRVYVAQKALMNLEGRRRRSRHPSLVPASIDPDLGIEVSSFDETINKMNEIQDAIVWGGDE